MHSSHEHYDGGGYPDGLQGDQIPLAARVVAVADAYSAMTTRRTYREAMAPGARCASCARTPAANSAPSWWRRRSSC